MNFIYRPRQPGPEELAVRSCLQAGEVDREYSLASDYDNVNYNSMNSWFNLLLQTTHVNISL